MDEPSMGQPYIGANGGLNTQGYALFKGFLDAINATIAANQTNAEALEDHESDTNNPHQTTFLSLPDTIDEYTAEYVLRVNPAGDGVEAIAAPWLPLAGGTLSGNLGIVTQAVSTLTMDNANAAFAQMPLIQMQKAGVVRAEYDGDALRIFDGTGTLQEAYALSGGNGDTVVLRIGDVVRALVEGGIMEVGLNANGVYTWFRGGLLICNYRDSGLTSTSVQGSGFRSPSTATWTYPLAYTAEPFVGGRPDSDSRWLMAGACGATAATYRHASFVSAGASVATELVAIGYKTYP